VTDERIPRRSQDSGIYTGTDKKLAVLRDFSCVDLCLGEKCPFLCHNIPLSIQSPFSDSQWSEKNKKIPPVRAVVFVYKSKLLFFILSDTRLIKSDKGISFI
jgi:hypothetical protein